MLRHTARDCGVELDVAVYTATLRCRWRDTTPQGASSQNGDGRAETAKRGQSAEEGDPLRGERCSIVNDQRQIGLAPGGLQAELFGPACKLGETGTVGSG